MFAWSYVFSTDERWDVHGMQKRKRQGSSFWFLDWTARDTLAIGIAALALGLMSRHLLGDELGFNILAGVKATLSSSSDWFACSCVAKINFPSRPLRYVSLTPRADASPTRSRASVHGVSDERRRRGRGLVV